MAAPTSEERREVAERIRALPSDIYSTIKGWEKDGLFIHTTLCDEADYSQIHNAVFGCFPAEYMHPGDREELHERLAELIDPTCHNQHPRASDGCFCCSECLFLYEPTDWSACGNSFLYCPRCGARVVRGGED